VRQVKLSASAHALKQPALELRFEAAHLLADGRLRDEISLRGLRKAFRLDEVAEYLQGLNVHFELPVFPIN
jgi:hypothetical protein